MWRLEVTDICHDVAMMLIEDHSVGGGSWNQKPAKIALKFQEPELSVWSGTQRNEGS